MKRTKDNCPYCHEEFTEIQHGRGLACSACGGKIDVFPDDSYYIDTPFGVLGIGIADEVSWRNTILSGLLRK